MNARTTLVALGLALVATLPAPPAAAAAGVRVVPLAALASREAFDTILSSAMASGDQSLLVPVGLFEDPPAILADMVSMARSRGLRVVAAVNVTRVASANEWPASREHVLYTHPEWLMVPRELSLELARLDVRSPDYAGRLARWARANAEKAMGLYLSPVHTDAAAFVAGAVRRLVERIPFDGVQFEAARYPSGDFDYSRLSLEELRREIRGGLSTDERRRLDGIEVFDPFAYAKEFPDAWRRFRQTQLTALVVRARTAVKSVRPDAIVSAVVGSDPLAALSDYLQDWPTWLDNRFIDAVTVEGADAPSPLPSLSGNPHMARFDAARHVLERAIAGRAFPGAIVEVGTDRDVLGRFASGTLSYDAGSPAVRDDTVYDLASLTKVLSTTPLVMREIERGSMALDDVLPHLLPGCRTPTLAEVTVEDLLSHCAGFPAYRPFYRTLEGEDAFEAGICATPLEYVPRSQSIYSDLGFILLGIVLGRGVALQQRFDAMWTQMATGEELQFLPPAKWRTRTAPTERDAWRRRLLQGEVHDENAAALGGVAGHAGLFGTAPAVGAFARHVFQVLDGRTGVFAQSSLRRFIARRPGVPGSSRALGWDTMLPTSSCGTRMSPEAFGHTGFTGTSLWLDPATGVYVVLLTNRVHPTRDNDAIQRVRPALHDAVMSDVRLPGR